MRVKYTLDACVDCVAFAVNGEVPEDRPSLEQEIANEIGAEDVRHLVYAAERSDTDGDAADDWFSWSSCECCGSTLGGNRYTLAVLTDEPETA